MSVALVGSLAVIASAQRPVVSAVPVDPIDAIIAAFASHPVVALGEPHGNEQAFQFRHALVRDLRFPTLVNDIVVESGTARYQATMDRFVSGQDVPLDELRHVWQDTTQNSAVWDRPIYREFFEAIRAVNGRLKPEQRLRVLLGDPPVDWDAVQRRTADIGVWTRDRDRYPAELIEREVLAKHRRALVIYGDAHLSHGGNMLVGRLEESAGIRVFSIAVALGRAIALQPEIASWPAPTLAAIHGTTLDAKEFEYYDALLWLGAPSTLTFSRLPRTLCEDASYLAMRRARMASQGAERQQEELDRECSASSASGPPDEQQKKR
jgi:hypothetical protein